MAEGVGPAFDVAKLVEAQPALLLQEQVELDDQVIHMHTRAQGHT